MPAIVITGGHGSLARAIQEEFLLGPYQVLAPARSELDVRRPQVVSDYFSSREEVINLLINNAGITRDTRLARMSPEAWQETIDTNLSGAWHCCQAFITQLPETAPGHIINISSFSGLAGPAGQANYAASKAGLLGLTQSLAGELGGRDVRVNAILPGFLETKMTRSLAEPLVETYRKAHVLGRFNTVNGVAQFVRFLHESMVNVSGQIFQLDSRLRHPGW